MLSEKVLRFICRFIREFYFIRVYLHVMKFIYILLLLFFFIPCSGQQPTILSLKGYGGSSYDQFLTQTTKTNDGGFIAAMNTGSPSGTGNIDSFCIANEQRTIFVKYNADASIIEWSKCYNIDGDSVFLYMYPMPDGGNILLGNFFNTNRGGIYITRHDAGDNIIWSKSHSKFANTINTICAQRTYDGGFIVAGAAFDTDSNVTTHYGAYTDADISVFRLDSLGNKLWSKVYGGTGYEYVKRIIEGPNHSWYLIGSTPSDDNDCTGNHNGSNDVYLLRLDSNGNAMWHKDLGGSDYDRGWDACTNEQGGIIIAAQTMSSDGDIHHHIGLNNTNIWIANLDSTSDIIWENCLGGAIYDAPYSICRATDGSIWVTGVSSGVGGEVDTFYGGNTDVITVRADSNGNFLSAKVLGSTVLAPDAGNVVYPLSGGLVFVAGYYANNDGSFADIFPVEATPGGGENGFTAIFAPWTTAVKNIQFTNNLRIFPNPAKQQVEIILTSPEKSSLRIVDVSGKLVYEGIISDRKTISVEAWHKGIYFVQVVNGKNELQVQKVIVQ